MKLIKQGLRDFVSRGVDAVDRIITKINKGSSARRGRGMSGRRDDRSRFEDEDDE